MKGPIPDENDSPAGVLPSAATGRRHRERPAVLVGAAVLMWWAYLVLGSNLPWLLAAIGVTVIAIWLLREHRAVAASSPSAP